MAQMPAARGWKPAKRSSGFSHTRRRQFLRRRSISKARRSQRGSSPLGCSRPSLISSTVARPPSTRRAQSRLKACRLSLIRVPPDKSRTNCATATSGSRRQRARGARQARAEDETVHPCLGMAEGMCEVQQHSRVAAHRTRDVGQHHKRHRARARALPAQLPGLAALARHRAQRGAAVGT
jgi:hypothetical protein